MKRRYFDHIDLRVKNMEAAKEFYRQFLPQVGFVRGTTRTVTASGSGRRFPHFLFCWPRQTV